MSSVIMQKVDENSIPYLDDLDRRILRTLQADARQDNLKIAEQVHTSAATCHRRTQRLLTREFVKTCRAIVRPEVVELGVLVILGVVLDRSTPDSFAAFEAAACKVPIVIDCYLVAGDFDYFMKVRVKDVSSLNKIHATTILRLPGVRQTRTFFVMKEVIDGGPLVF